MSNPLVKPFCAAILIVIPLLLEWRAGENVKKEIATLRAAQTSAAVAPATADRPTGSGEDIVSIRAARVAAENRVAQLEELQRQLENEVVISLGTVETMAKKLVATTSLFAELEARKGAETPPDEAERKALREKAERAAEGMAETMSIMTEIGRLERSPEKAARFYATLLGESKNLSAADRESAEELTRGWLVQLQNNGLALPQRPAGETKEWDARRDESMKQFLQALEQRVPALAPAQQLIERLFPFGDGRSNYDLMTGGKPR